jgi:hypothetical protein
MSVHTPGPWQASDDCGDFENGTHPCVYDAAGNKLATFWVQRAVGAGSDATRIQCEHTARAEANACLAAAAPALAHALRMAADFIENVADETPGRTERFFACREAWRNALAGVQS